MDDSRLNPVGRSIADQRDRDRRIKDAQDLAQTIARNAERTGAALPPYEFLELIGKGAFGKVYKCLDRQTKNLVAVKIIDIDEQDWSEDFSLGDARDATINDFKKEVSILRQLKDNNAKNINLIHDAFDWHSQLWIVADYCTGGSVRTLMRPFEKNGRPIGLPEQYIVPIARELAIAMKSMHDLNTLHRDIKCANVYITEDGDIQLGDFGIVGVIDHDHEKRKTVVGTPHWMPREIVERLGDKETKEGYGYEVDVWSFGCTVYEMATGSPPYATKGIQFLTELLEESPPRLEGSEYSAELRDFVAFCLNPDKKARPSASAILNHPYIKDTSRIYPTRTLVRLIERFKIWEHGGGSRLSLWQASPADSRNLRLGDDDEVENDEEEQDDWNFSTSEDFDQELGRRLSQLPPGAVLEGWNFDSPATSSLPPLQPQPLQTKALTVAERIKQEHSEKSASRGEKSLNKVFDPNDPTGYQLATPIEPPQPPEPEAPSDLPLRAYESSSTSRESVVVMLDLDDAITPATSSLAMRMAAINEDTIRPTGRHAHDDDDDDDDDGYQYGRLSVSDKRDTRAWTFDSAQPRTQRDTRDWTFETALPLQPPLPTLSRQPERETISWSFETAGLAAPELLDDSYDVASGGNDGCLAPTRPQLQHTATEPIRHFRGLSSSSVPNRESVTSLIDLDAGLAERVRAGNEILRPGTASSHMTDATSGNPFDLEDDPEQKELDRNRFSYHKPYASEGGMVKRLSHKTMPMHARGTSLSSTEPDLDPGRPAVGGYSAPPSAMSQPDLSFSTLEQGLGLATVETDNNQWPSFSDNDSFTDMPQYLPASADDTHMPRLGQGFSTEHRLHASGTSVSSRSREPSNEPPGPEVDFPSLQPPHPDVLAESADDQILEAELGRMLSDCDYALSSMSRVLHQHASIEADDDDEISSDFDSSFGSRHQDTEDEDIDHLTARRKPRKLEMRSSPRLPTD